MHALHLPSACTGSEFLCGAAAPEWIDEHAVHSKIILLMSLYWLTVHSNYHEDIAYHFSDLYTGLRVHIDFILIIM